MKHVDPSSLSLRDLFRIEAEEQTKALTDALLALEKDPAQGDMLECCMRAAHSLKGAARIVGVHPAVTVAHAMEDIFVLAQGGQLRLAPAQIDLLLSGVDLLSALAGQGEGENFDEDIWQADAERFAAALTAAPVASEPEPAPPPVIVAAVPEIPSEIQPAPASERLLPEKPGEGDRALRVSAENLNRLLDMAGESLVETRRLAPLEQSLLRLKRMHHQAAAAIDALQAALPADLLDERTASALEEARRRLFDCRRQLAGGLDELEASNHRTTNLAHRLYNQALMVRMRPFADGMGGFPRMVRDIARELGKQVRFEILGERTQVDRDILEKLDAPLGHLLRNALDHGMESPEERRAAGKPAEGFIRVEASHQAGALRIIVSDDGRGIDLSAIRRTIIARGLAAPDTAARLSEAELLEFLFLPGFTMKSDVTEISGRGVGLDIVQDMIRQVRGRVRIISRHGEGTRFRLELPLTLSVVRALLVDIGGEPYAFPFAHIAGAMKVPADQVRTVEGRQHILIEGNAVGLVGAHQVLGCAPPDGAPEELCVVLLGAGDHMFALVVDGFTGGRELVVQPLDPRLGKIKDISAASLTEDGAPLLIVDVEDMLRSLEKLAATDRLAPVGREIGVETGARRKRVLVVDDSFTVRELQRKLLDHHGYDVEVAVDGMDGWNALRHGGFDLVVSDIDMPRMDGIELVRRIRHDPALKAMPVMILSYKDREEDRRRGLEVGADYYLTKGSFQNDALIDAVIDLIGESAA
ncbi:MULTISPECIES: hybrid sensor histidine kinase/response regulator [unclassified Novosphingobium]|uniref:hybrid sensor histidine kinase/response regulator n=1 Tax=unclassified Novosphingobium TaxID=2644732 RepID=UPI00086CDCDF|nr:MULTISPECIES: hybrid sensor histidine kinase/response regulator [unclassified Novosphingobium]MDR6708715.1 two-component system sensor histidine kinase and response regulator WspE [Novosphingobium sp. 1748]ODU81872.1 MAG: hybrid sensor histidine kinase/response regulator [Novosphingobium sp. SCN 63-17]OJX96663.1 MAG: hybrid sensor histidine kinase/response regulator [Novosphingobium sp. 63-713]